jgi:ABC-type sugar transport system ATPase subunit
MANEAIVLRYDDVVLKPGRKPVSGTVKAGEITGLAGLEGHGQEEFLLTLAGLGRMRDCAIHVETKDHGPVRLINHREAARHGVVYLPRDRRSTGIFPVLSVLDNFGIASMPHFSRAGILDRRRQRAKLASYAQFLSIKYPSMSAPISSLSGGNQQKVLLARLLALEPGIMLLNDPTRGVDLNTRLKFYDAFRQLARESQIAFVILSSEIEEILHICDSVSIFRDFERTEVITREHMTMSGVMAAMFGQGEPAA